MRLTNFWLIGLATFGFMLALFLRPAPVYACTSGSGQACDCWDCAQNVCGDSGSECAPNFDQRMDPQYCWWVGCAAPPPTSTPVPPTSTPVPPTSTPIPTPAYPACPGGASSCGDWNYGQLGSCAGYWTWPDNNGWSGWCQTQQGKNACYTCNPWQPSDTPSLEAVLCSYTGPADTATLNWNALTYATPDPNALVSQRGYYNLRYGNNQTVNGIRATTTTLGSLIPNSTYTWSVQGCNDLTGTCGPWATPESFTCPPAPTPTITPTPTFVPPQPALPPPAPNVTLNIPESCITVSHSGDDLLNITWTDNLGDPVTWADILEASNTYHKSVSGGSTTAPAGFNGFGSTSGALVIKPGVTYQARLFDGMVNGPVTSFSIPACPTSTLTPTLTSSPTPVSSPTLTATPTPSLTPTPTPLPVTVSFRLAESQQSLDSAPDQTYTASPMPVSFTFSDKSLGVKTLWVRFRDNRGQTVDKSAAIMLVNRACTSVALRGLGSSGINASGGPIYQTDSAGANYVIDVNHVPSDDPVTLNSSSGEMTITSSNPGNGNVYVLNAPANNTATEKSYTLSGVVGPANAAVSCLPVTVKVAPAGPPNCNYNSTEVKFRSDANDTWVKQKTITLGSSVTVAGFHNGETPAMPPSDINLHEDGPNGESNSLTNNSVFQPTQVGVYLISGTTTGKSGSACQASGSTLTVTAIPTPTPTLFPTLTPTLTPIPTPTPLPPCTSNDLMLQFSNSAGGPFVNANSPSLTAASGSTIFAQAYDVNGNIVTNASIKYRTADVSYFTNYPSSGVVIGSQDLVFQASRPDFANCGVTTNIHIKQPEALSCTNFQPMGMSTAPELGEGGRQIYIQPDYRGGIRVTTANRSVGNATIHPTATKSPASAPDLTFQTTTDGSGNQAITIPTNDSTADDYNYTVNAIATAGNSSTNCTPGFILRVPKKPVDTSCPAEITSTEARVKPSGADWTTNGVITLGQTAQVGGFHNRQTNTFAGNVTLTVDGPEGPESHQVTLAGSENGTSFTPTRVGKYTVTVSEVGRTGNNCTGSATLTVNAVPEATLTYQIAETEAGLAATEARPYSNIEGKEPIEIVYTFVDKTPGFKTLFVKFTDNKGNTQVVKKTIILLAPAPTITGADCHLSLTGQGTDIVLRGQYFGEHNEQQGSGKVVVSGQEADLNSWSNEDPTRAVIVAHVANKLTGKMPIELTIDDGRKVQARCALNTTTIDFTARSSCPSALSSGISDVSVSITEATSGAKPLIKQKIDIDQNGQPSGDFTPLLEKGKKYNLIVKALGKLAKRVGFMADDGTTVLPDITLPAGDIAPVAAPDGVINSLDKGEMVREWNPVSDTLKAADLNGDSRVNSLDYACLRENIGKSDESSVSTAP